MPEGVDLRDHQQIKKQENVEALRPRRGSALGRKPNALPGRTGQGRDREGTTCHLQSNRKGRSVRPASECRGCQVVRLDQQSRPCLSERLQFLRSGRLGRGREDHRLHDSGPPATSIIAAFRRQSGIAIGNIVGSNIFNVLGILRVTALIKPVPVADRFLTFDLPIMIAASLALTALLLTRPVIGRFIGLVVLVAYVTYVWLAQ